MVEIEMTVSKRKLGNWVPRNVDRILQTCILSYIRKYTIEIKDFVAGLRCHNRADNCFCTRESVISRF